MKFLLLIFFLSCQFLLATSFAYINKDISTKNYSLKQGSKVEIIKEINQKVEIKISASINANNELFFDKNQNYKIGSYKNYKKNNSGIYIFKIDKENLSKSSAEVWEEAQDMYYEGCTQCHSAMETYEHTMLEWEGIFESMKDQAQLEEDENLKILSYLKSHAQDGFIKEEE